MRTEHMIPQENLDAYPQNTTLEEAYNAKREEIPSVSGLSNVIGALSHELGHVIHNPKTTPQCLLGVLKLTSWTMNRTNEQLIKHFEYNQAK